VPGVETAAPAEKQGVATGVAAQSEPAREVDVPGAETAAPAEKQGVATGVASPASS
jgi:hypothetical protein